MIKHLGEATCSYLLLLAAKDRAKEAASFVQGRSRAAFQEQAVIQLAFKKIKVAASSS